jgi:hypothetical protein
VNRDERNNLNAERYALQKMIAEVPADDVLDRLTLEARLRDVERQLAAGAAPTRLPMAATLTFRGQPVVASQGVYAEFGMAATQAFTRTVSTMAASFAGTLAATGPIPNQDQHQLLITSTAIGSFGFKLEEPGDALMFDIETPVGHALVSTQKLLESTTGSDDDMTEVTAGTDPRVIKSARDFLEVLAGGDAVCNLTVGTKTFRFADVAQVRRAIDRLAQENIHEQDESFTGVFQGVLPKGRTFEFRIQNDDTVLRGKIGSSVHEPAELNHHLDQPITVKFIATRVGNATPKYVLRDLPNWTSA